MKTDMDKFMDRIADATEKDLENKTIWHLFGSAAEELGELSAEMMIEDNVFGHGDKKVDEGSKAEAVDLTICALALFFARGGTVKELIDIGHSKLDKWEKSQKESKRGSSET